jgi:hypothetical protein
MYVSILSSSKYALLLLLVLPLSLLLLLLLLLLQPTAMIGVPLLIFLRLLTIDTCQ